MIEAGLTVEGRAIYDLQPRQLECLTLTPLCRESWQPGPVHIGYGGAAGGGKSYLARAVASIAAWKWKGSTSIIFRRTYGEVRDNHIVKFRAEVPDTVEGQRLYSYSAQDKAIRWVNGSRTMFGYLENDDDVYRYHGAEYDLMIFEEATHYSWFQVSWLTGNRLRSSVAGTVPFALYPSNPGNIGHAWYKRLFIDREFRGDLDVDEDPADYAFVQAKVEDNQILVTNDPRYLKKLNSLPEPYRSQLRDGDWTAGTASALGELRRDIHLVKAFEIPDHWERFGSFDWGFNHPFSFGYYAQDSDGTVYLVDTVTGRHLKDLEIIERIWETDTVEVGRLRYTVAGHDVKHEHRARSDSQETTMERFGKAGIPLTLANIARISGLKNMRHYIDHERLGRPRFFVMDTPNNREVYRCLESMVTDPDNIEDALKIDADDYGQGGDDHYDMVRYALASRPIKVTEPTEPLPEKDYDRGFEEMIDKYQRRQRQKRSF